MNTKFYYTELQRDGVRYQIRKDGTSYILTRADGTETTLDSIGAVREAIGSVDTDDTRMTVRRADGTAIWETFL